MGWFWTMVAGFALELVGFAFAAVGLWQTWRANADGRPFFPAWVQRLVHWLAVKVLRRKPEAVTLQGVGFMGTATMDAAGFVSHGLTDDMTIEAKIAAVQANALRALQDASNAHSAVRAEQRAREKADEELESRLVGTERTLTAFARGLTVDGIPLAIAGLAFAVIGLFLQAVAAVATFQPPAL